MLLLQGAAHTGRMQYSFAEIMSPVMLMLTEQ
jgi:hypothetical protein